MTSPRQTSQSKQTPSTETRRRSAKSRKPAHLTKADLEAILLRTQKQLLDTEKKLAAQGEEVRALHNQVAEKVAAFEDMKTGQYDNMVNAILAEHRYQEAQTLADTALAELRHMTQLLANSENESIKAKAEAEALENTRTSNARSHKAALEKLQSEISDLREKLYRAEEFAEQAEAKIKTSEDARTTDTQKYKVTLEKAKTEIDSMRKKLRSAEKANSMSEKHATEIERRLTNASHELIEMSELLKQSEARADARIKEMEEALSTARLAVQALITPPELEPLGHERLSKAVSVLIAADLLDPDWYAANNSDVTEAGVDPALHFLQFGLSEGRAPRSSS